MEVSKSWDLDITPEDYAERIAEAVKKSASRTAEGSELEARVREIAEALNLNKLANPEDAEKVIAMILNILNKE